MSRIAVADVVVGPRIRDDKGDIATMAASLKRYGQIEPIVVAGEDNALVCGERRLLAARSLGWDEIHAEILWGLSSEQRFDLEREENEQRKTLTEGERSKRWQASKALVEKAKAIAPKVAERISSSASEEKDPRGRKSAYDAPKAAVADALGVSTGHLVAAEQHVAAAERYPELKMPGITQEAAITVAKNLDKLPEPERAEKQAALRRFDQDVLAELAEKPPMPKEPRPEMSAGARWTKAAHQVWMLINSVRDAGGIEALAEQWEPSNRAGFQAEVHRMATTLADWDQSLERGLQHVA